MSPWLTSPGARGSPSHTQDTPRKLKLRSELIAQRERSQAVGDS